MAPIMGLIVALPATVNSAIFEPAKLPKVIKNVPAAAVFDIVRCVKTTRVLVVGVQMAKVLSASHLWYRVFGVSPMFR